MKILLIEDDVDTAAYIIEGVRQLGHVFDHVRDGERGMKAAVNERYELAIVDRMLPGMDGLSIVKAMREDCAQRLQTVPRPICAHKSSYGLRMIERKRFGFPMRLQ